MSLGTKEYAPKTTIFTAPDQPQEAFDFAAYRRNLIEQITAHHPADFYKHNDTAVELDVHNGTYSWKEDVLRNMDTIGLTFMLTILTNQDSLRNR